MNQKLTSTQARVDAQLELEALSVELGIQRYRECLQREGTMGSTAGQQLLRAAMDPMVEALKTWLEETREGLASKSASVFYAVDQYDPVVVAYLTASTVLQEAAAAPNLTSSAIRLAMALEGEDTLAKVAAAQPALAKKMVKKLATINTDRDRALFIRRGGALAEVKVVAWDTAVRVRVGTLLLTMFAESTGLVAIETVTVRGRSNTILRLTESCRQWLEESHARCELMQPVALPMLCRPRDWRGPFGGGYLTPRLRQPLVKTRNKGYLQTLKENWEMPLVYASVNALQDTAWSVNERVYEVVKALWEGSSTLGGLPPREDLGVPSKPWTEGEEPAPEVLQAWKVSAAKVYQTNGRVASKRVQLVQKLYVAELMMERGNRFHYVYNLDWRGRMYPVGPALTPQGDDVAKGMLHFAHSSRLGDDGAYWLAIHGANTYGVDKVAFEERIRWVEENEQMILACAQDPYVFREWADADSPYCFLAFCFEWADLQRWVAAGCRQENFESRTAVAFDGSCNGLQNFSAMLRDPVGGAATGLIPSHKPSDIYTEVAKAAQAMIDERAREGCPQAARWVGRVTRSLAKRNTMTVPYGVTLRGMQGQLFDQLQKDGLSDNPREDAQFLAEINHEAIGQVVVAARLAMDWLKAAAKVAAKNSLPVRWTSPVGFLALQDYRSPIGRELDFVALGRRFRLMLERDGDKLNGQKQALGIAPNFVHSLDAAHLMRTVLLCAQDGMRDLATIHDSYGCHAGNATRLRDNLRAAFVAQYEGNVLERFRDELVEQLPAELVEQLPPLPPMGSLDLQGVLQSEYFFA